MNKVILMGRLTRDAEIRYTQGQEPMAIARFTLAIDRMKTKSNDNPGADFISCIAFAKRGEFFEKYGRKGTKFLVEGHIQTGSYTHRDGYKVYTTDVIVDSVEFAESKASAGGGDAKAQPEAQPVDKDGFMFVPDGIDEELPFV